ncbi:unnamed protein product, partial [Medioppia subpectinata]
EHLEASEVLTKLNVWKSQTLQTGLPGWLLNQSFRDSLKTALLGGGEQWSVYKELPKDKHSPDIESLDSYANKRWESILHFMVERKHRETDVISNETKNVLLHANLIRLDDPNGIPDITANGFQFLLMNISSQVFYFLLKYLDTIQSKGLDLAEALIFLFQLSFLSLGKDYSTEGMTDSSLLVLQNLREFGLVYQRKRKDGRFYPTRLAINLVSGLKGTSLHTKKSGFIIVETNYRVYAYTESTIQIALLAIFTEMQYRFPKFVLGVITRESCRQAFKCGITAKQIVNYLDYSTEGMTDSSLLVLQNLREFGLVYQRKRKDGRFYPTRLAINLVSGLKGTSLHTKKSGFIIVETNYRVYAYTESTIQIALLAIFTEMQYRFPKFVLGVITRESCRQAFKCGITAKQIVNYLVMHSHPQLHHQNPIIPGTV